VTQQAQPAVPHIDIVFDGPPSHESGRFVEVEDASGNSIRIGEWVELPLNPPIPSRPPLFALRIDDPRALRRELEGATRDVTAVWELLDHRVDGQPFWTERDHDLGMSVALVLKHYRDQIAEWKAAWNSAHPPETNAPKALKAWADAMRQHANRASRSISELESRALEQGRQITKLCEEKEAEWKRAERLQVELDAARSARDSVFLDLQKIREATMLEPAGGDWAKITPDHVRQQVQDLADGYTKAKLERDQLAAQALEWAKAAHHIDHTIIVPPQLKAAAERVSDELAKARVERDEWKAAARRLGSKIEKPEELAAAIESLAEGVRTGSRACVDLEALRKEHTRDQSLIDTLGRILLGPDAPRPYGHAIERAALETKRIADALPEAGKLIGITNLTPQTFVERVSRIVEENARLNAATASENRLTNELRTATAQLSEIRAHLVKVMYVGDHENDPQLATVALAYEIASWYRKAIAQRDELLAEMANGVDTETVINALEAARGQYDRDEMREALVRDIGAVPANSATVRPLAKYIQEATIGKIADAALDRFEAMLRAPVETAADDSDDEEITIGLDDACDILGDVLVDHVADSKIEGIVDEFRERWETDPKELAEAAAAEEDEPAAVELSDEQIDSIVDKLAARLSSTGATVRVIKRKG
jgi:hypothetical protein